MNSGHIVALTTAVRRTPAGLLQTSPFQNHPHFE